VNLIKNLITDRNHWAFWLSPYKK